jgi:hypothetical protein
MRIARGFLWISVLVLVFGFTTASLPSRTAAQVVVSVSFGPPELPVYEQPLCPGEGYIWTPGYWAWDTDADDYFWVPGTWVLPPQVGFLWTPGYWAWNGAAFAFYEGYWGPLVGFYGGINYGYGYFGRGYEGGRWDHDRFYYNRSVNNVNVAQIHNVYNTTIVNNNSTRISYNGGNGGIGTRPTSDEIAAARSRQAGPVSQQVQHVQAARTDQSLRASQNHGKPPIAATPRPAAFSEHGVVAAREGGKYNPPPGRNAYHGSPSGDSSRPNEAPPARSSRPTTVVHPNDAPPHTNLPAPNTGNPKLDQKYQQEQEKLRAKQEQEHQRLQQKQDQEHQKSLKKQADEARKQQMEQRHQQQTQQMEQKHAQQSQKLQQQQEQAAPHPNSQKPPRP